MSPAKEKGSVPGGRGPAAQDAIAAEAGDSQKLIRGNMLLSGDER
jgi:hypothetical protein